nr:hypothetical protein OH820_18285 [Streptomyces sp. NBC_00857]
MTSTEYRRNAERLLTRQPGFTPTPAMVAEADTVRADHLDGPGFATLCQKGRKLRQDTGQLSGDAVGDVTAAADAAGVTVPPVLSDVLEVMRHSVRMYTADLLAALVNLDEDVYGDFDAERLAAELTAAGVDRKSKQVKINGASGAGYQRRDIEGAVPVELLLAQNG